MSSNCELKADLDEIRSQLDILLKNQETLLSNQSTMHTKLIENSNKMDSIKRKLICGSCCSCLYRITCILIWFTILFLVSALVSNYLSSKNNDFKLNDTFDEYTNIFGKKAEL